MSRWKRYLLFALLLALCSVLAIPATIAQASRRLGAALQGTMSMPTGKTG